MSKLAVCSVMDAAIGVFSAPMFVYLPHQAVRSFTDEVNRPSVGDKVNMLNAHPEDFTLHLLAEFDEETGRFSEPEGGPRVLIRGKDAVRG